MGINVSMSLYFMSVHKSEFALESLHERCKCVRAHGCVLKGALCIHMCLHLGVKVYALVLWVCEVWVIYFYGPSP